MAKSATAHLTTARPPSKRARDAPGADGTSRRTLLPLVSIAAVSLVLRLVYLAQIRGIGFIDQPVSDAFIFVARARGIAAGDWLGPADFVHAPLYAYVLGIIRVLGGEAWAPRIVQAVLGSASCVVVFLACRRLLGQAAATVAGLLLAVYPPAIFFDGLIQKTELALLLSALLLWSLASVSPTSRWWHCAVAGMTLGMLALTRQNALALVPLVIVWNWVRVSAANRQAAAFCSAACAAGLVAAILPWAMRNKVVIGAFVLTTPNLGQNFAMGNSERASGTYLEFEPGTGRAETEQWAWTRTVARALGRAPTPSEVSDYFLKESLTWIRQHPAEWIRLLIRKWLMVWNAYEAFDTEDYYLYRARAPLLGALDPAIHFGTLAPVAAAGVVLTARNWRRLWLLYVWLLITALAVAVFVVFARYRFPLIPVLVMFAAAGIVEGAVLVAQRRLRRLAGAGAALLVAAVVTNWPIIHPRAPNATSYANHAVVLRDAKRYDDALAEIAKALSISPEHVRANLAACNTLSEMGRYNDALPYCERACTAAPDFSAAYRGLGDAYLGLRRIDKAVELYEQALAVDPDDYRALNMLATALAQDGSIDEALERFARVIDLAPDYAEGHLNLGNTYFLEGRLEEAAGCYERALALRPDFIDALHNLGVVEMDRGHLERAIELFRKALEVDPNYQPAKSSLDEVLNGGRR